MLAARLFVSTSDTGPDHVMPFYLMPTLGGNDTLRGFREYRFRGPHAILGQAEYRWEIWSGLDGALFYDAGKVADRRADLNFKDLERDYGFGFRFNTDEGDRLSRRCWLRESEMANTCTSSLAAVSRRTPDEARRRAASRVGRSLERAASDRPRGPPRPRFYPDDPIWSDDDRAFDASKVVTIEDTQRLRLRREHVQPTRASAATCAR